MRVLVTGGTGFIGRAVIQQLLLGRHETHALVRSGSPPEGCRVLRGELPNLPSSLPDVDAVVHLASPRPGADLATFRDVNVTATQNLLDRVGTKRRIRFVYVSSVKAVTEGGSTEPISEETEPHPTTPYGLSKRSGERLVLEGGVEPVVLRFPLVYGPGMTTPNMLKLFGAVARGVPLPLGGISNKRSFLYVDHAAEAVLLALQEPQASGEIYMVADTPPIGSSELITEIGRALGTPARLFTVPQKVWRAVASVGDRLPQRLPLLRAADLDRLVGSLVVDSFKIRNELGWHADVSLEEGLKRTAVWFSRRHRA